MHVKTKAKTSGHENVDEYNQLERKKHMHNDAMYKIRLKIQL